MYILKVRESKRTFLSGISKDYDGTFLPDRCYSESKAYHFKSIDEIHKIFVQYKCTEYLEYYEPIEIK